MESAYRETSSTGTRYSRKHVDHAPLLGRMHSMMLFNRTKSKAINPMCLCRSSSLAHTTGPFLFCTDELPEWLLEGFNCGSLYYDRDDMWSLNYSKNIVTVGTW